ncbi:DUF559 domain-containing protein [Demequina sediminicola]|uniref:DUF559 domain-containing protein n=1 Tax=Demequina sediminicola TaxID=1095026 RepID=UPI000785C5FD|nr:DUF559 domain-containing protein [Demequina sediminicola]
MTPRPAFAVYALVAALAESGVAHPRRHVEERWSSATLTSALQSGDVVRVGPGLFAHRDAEQTMRCRLSVAAQWLPQGGAVAGRAALWCAGWRDEHPAQLHAIVPRAVRTPAPPLLKLRRTDIEMAATHIEGVPVVNSADALILAWQWTQPHERIGFACDAFRSEVVRPADVARRTGFHPRIPNRTDLESACSLASRGVTSMLEYRAMTEVFTGDEWDRWEVQAPVSAGGRTFVVDMLLRAARVAVEFDGARYHSDDLRRRRDLERDALLAGAGYVTVRLTWEDIAGRPGWCRRQVRLAVARRTATDRADAGGAAGAEIPWSG